MASKQQQQLRSEDSLSQTNGSINNNNNNPSLIPNSRSPFANQSPQPSTTAATTKTNGASKSSPKSGIWRVLLRTLPVIVILLTLTWSIFLFVYLSRTSWHGAFLTTTKPLGDVLLLTTAACKIVFTAIPLLMTAAAYPIADAWIKRRKAFEEQMREEHPELFESDTAAVPDKIQHATMAEAFTAANLSAALKGTLVLFRAPTEDDKKTQEGQSRTQSNEKLQRQSAAGETKDALSRQTLKRTVLTLLSLLILAYLIFLVDMILHGTSKAIAVTAPPRNAGAPASAAFSRILRPECQSLDPVTQRPCTIDYYAGGMFGAEYIEAAYIKQYPEAVKVLSGTSQASQVVSIPYQNRQVAALVPSVGAISESSGSDEQKSSWDAETVGMYAECSAMTQTCNFADVTACTDENATGCGQATCDLQGYPSMRAFASGSTPTGILKRYITGTNRWDFEKNSSNGTDVNPMVFLFSAIFDAGDEDTTRAAGLYSDIGWGRGVNTTLSSIVLICNANVVDLSVHYATPEPKSTDSGFTITSLSPAAHNGTVRAVTSIIDMQQSPLDLFFSELEPYAATSLSSSAGFISSFEKIFGATYLPFAHSAFTTKEAEILFGEEVTAMGTRLSMALLIIYMILILTFTGVAIYLAICSVKIHLEAKWEERKEKNAHEESGRGSPSEKSGVDERKGSGDETRDAAETFTDPIAMTYDDAKSKAGDTLSDFARSKSPSSDPSTTGNTNANDRDDGKVSNINPFVIGGGDDDDDGNEPKKFSSDSNTSSVPPPPPRQNQNPEQRQGGDGRGQQTGNAQPEGLLGNIPGLEHLMSR
ncbi:hypothetical protein FRB91_003794 [Serendipita sp. 411]|nr:hypothetical protein FRB91_003794 [Serendipita sp. 411]